MSKEGDQHLGQMKEEKAESLGSLNAIQKDFEKFYFTAMVSQGARPLSAIPQVWVLLFGESSCTQDFTPHFDGGLAAFCSC